MKGFMKKLSAIALAAAMMITGVSINAVAAPYIASEYTVMRASVNPNNTHTFSLYVSLDKKTDKIKNVKSFNKSVLEFDYISRTHYKSESSYEYADPKKNTEYSYDSYYGYIYFKVKAVKNASTKVSFKVGNKTYSTTIKVVKYENPTKSVVIDGVNSGKSLVSKLNKDASIGGIKSNKGSKNAKISVTAKTGWKIASISYNNYTQHTSLSKGASIWSYYDEKKNEVVYKGGANSMSLQVGQIAKKDSGEVRIEFFNAKLKTYLTQYINFSQ